MISQTADPSAGISELAANLSKLVRKKEELLKELMKHFMIEKFSSRNRNVEAWIDIFEK